MKNTKENVSERLYESIKIAVQGFKNLWIATNKVNTDVKELESTLKKFKQSS